MSRENLEVVRESYRLFEAGDERWKEVLHPDIEWDFSGYPLADLPTRGRGREGVLDVIATYMSGWRDYSAEVIETLDAGDDVLVVQHEVVHVGDSEDALERDTFHLWTLRDGLWVRWRNFPDRAAAIDAMMTGE